MFIHTHTPTFTHTGPAHAPVTLTILRDSKPERVTIRRLPLPLGLGETPIAGQLEQGDRGRHVDTPRIVDDSQGQASWKDLESEEEEEEEDGKEEEEEDGHASVCMECGNPGQLICCDGCPNAYHKVVNPLNPKTGQLISCDGCPNAYHKAC